MSPVPAISVTLPVFNAEAYIGEAVESILGQTLADFELIIINDGSSDRSGPILQELAARDPRINLIERPNGGLVSALNDAIALARGDFIARMDADDIAMPERLALQYARMTSEPGLGVLGSFIRIVDHAGRTIRMADYPVTVEEVAKFIELGSPVAHPSVMIRRDVLRATGAYRQVFRHCEDYDLWLRITELGYGIANLPVPLLNYRVHGNNVSSVHREAQETATLVARAAHRSRKLGFGDPTSGMTALSHRSLAAFPAQIREHFEPELFALKYASISLAGRDALLSAWRDYEALAERTRRHPSMTGFLMRIARGSFENASPRLLIHAVLSAMRYHPKLALGMIFGKARRLFGVMRPKSH